MKGKTRLLLISAVLIFGMCVAGTGISWGDDSSPPLTGASPDGQTAVAQVDAATQAAPAGTGAPAQTQATPPTTPSATSTTAPGTQKVPVTEVEVKAEKEKKPKEGSAEVGYKVENTTTTGPWGEKKLQDTPYSISVMSSELIENVQASTPDQLFRMNPLTQLNYPQARAGNVNISVRGFSFNNSTYEDGIRNSAGYGIFLEDKERVEVVTGLSGFLYGQAGVAGGMVNYVTKRPTTEYLNSVTVGDYGGGSYYTHGDFGGKIDPAGKFAYRLNLLVQDGDTPVHYQSNSKYLASGALDWHVADNILLRFDGSHGHDEVDGLPAYWALANGVKNPSPPDPEKLWTQKWTMSKIDADRAGVNGRWDINDVFALRAAYGYISNEREWDSVNSTIKANGTYTELGKLQAPFKIIDNGGYTLLDAKFATFSVQQKVTAGFYGNISEGRYHQDASANIPLTGNFTLADPVYVPEPAYSLGTKRWYTQTESTNQNWLIGDDIKFNDQWSALAGLSNVTIDQRSFNTNGTEQPTSHFDKSRVTPTASLIYKPVPWISTYASYIESLLPGTIVPTTGSVTYTNGGQMLPPIVSEQYEVGAKATVGGLLLTGALFYIDETNQYASTNADGTQTYKQDGRVIHDGVEFTATGKATANLTLFGGLTLMDCKVYRTSSPALEDKTPTNVAEQMAKLYAEYAVPWVRGLTLTGGVYYTGTFYGDAMNTDKLPSVITGDVGARYTTTIFEKPVILRLNAMNVTNQSYWISTYYTGASRTIAFSVQMKF